MLRLTDWELVDLEFSGWVATVAESNAPESAMYKGAGAGTWLRMSPSALTAISTSASFSSIIPVARATGRSDTTVVVSILDMAWWLCWSLGAR